MEEPAAAGKQPPQQPQQQQPGAEKAVQEDVPGLVLLGYLGFKMLHVSSDRVEGTFTVGAKSTQPSNVLHGGVSAFLAETLASIGAQVASGWQRVAGIELNINHLRAVQAGTDVRVQASPLSVGNRVQVWEVRFLLEETEQSSGRGSSDSSSSSNRSSSSRLVAISRVTLIIGLPGTAAIRTHQSTKLLQSINSKL